MNTTQGHWSAEDWFGGTTDWVALCRDAHLDPALALEDDWAAAVEKVIAHERETADEIVSGVEDYVYQQALDYRQDFAGDGGWP